MLKNGVYALVKYTILCTGETKMLNLRKICPSMDIQGGCWIFRIQRGGFCKGEEKIPGVETPVGAMLWDI